MSHKFGTLVFLKVDTDENAAGQSLSDLGIMVNSDQPGDVGDLDGLAVAVGELGLMCGILVSMSCI